MLLLLLAAGALVAQAAPHEEQGQEDLYCKDYNDKGFFCVPAYQCNEDHVIKTTGEGLFEVRATDLECDAKAEVPEAGCCPPVRTATLRSRCEGTLSVCCLHPNSTDQYKRERLANCGFDGGEAEFEPVTPRTGGGEECSPIFGCDAPPPAPCDPIFDDCTNGAPMVTNLPFANQPDQPQTPVVDRSPAQPSCGYRNPDGIASLKDQPTAEEAEFGEWPHVCAVLKKESIGSDTDDPLKVYQCGASLLDNGVVLTAAHCIHTFQPEDLIVRCGEWNTQNEEETLPYQEREVEAIKIHPEFDNGNHHNNFAVMFVKRDFERARHIHPICLPPPCARYTDRNCVANGWGKDKFGSDGRYSTILKEIVYPVVAKDKCQDALRKTRLGQFFELDDSFLCAGGTKGVDTCKGDGGSPLVCKIEGLDRWVQAGIVSWGIQCGDTVPSVYASVASAVCWIDSEVNKFYRTASKFGFNALDCRGAVAVEDCSVSAVDSDLRSIDEDSFR